MKEWRKKEERKKGLMIGQYKTNEEKRRHKVGLTYFMIFHIFNLKNYQ